MNLGAVPLARARFDVALADLDSTSRRSRAAPSRARCENPMSSPPDPTYDVILVLDVLEHVSAPPGPSRPLPKDELHAIVDKLLQLKHANTESILSAPFGRAATHPIHLDDTEVVGRGEPVRGGMAPDGMARDGMARGGTGARRDGRGVRAETAPAPPRTALPRPTTSHLCTDLSLSLPLSRSI